MTQGLVIILLCGAAFAQRSPYAPRPVIYPGPLAKYTTEQPLSSGGLDTRFGAPSSLPGSIYSEDLANRVSSWPKDKQPFWYVNNQKITEHHQLQQQEQQQQQNQQEIRRLQQEELARRQLELMRKQLQRQSKKERQK